MVPIKLIMENFISHRLSEIDFTTFNAALIVGFYNGNPKIANGTGKSSILEAIRFALYGKTRFGKKEKIIKYGKAYCSVEFVFSMDGALYKVKRSMNRKTGTIDVGFYKREYDEWQPEGFTCDTPTLTNYKIESLIGMSHDTFVNCIYFRQNDISGFAGAKPSKRKDILKEVLLIGVWDEYYEIAKKHEKTLIDSRGTILDRLNSLKDVEKESDILKTKLLELRQKLELDKVKVGKLENELDSTNEKILKLEKVLSNDDNINETELHDRFVSVLQQINDVKKKRDSIKGEVQKNNEVIANADNDCIFLSNKLFELSKIILLVENKSRRKAEYIFKKHSQDAVPNIMFTIDDLNARKRDLSRHNRELDVLQSQLSHLVSLKPGKECPICLSEIKNPDDVMMRREVKQKFIENRIDELKHSISEIDSIIHKKEDMLIKANEASIELEKIELTIAKIESSKLDASSKNDYLREKFNVLANEWTQLKYESSRINSIIKALDDANSCQGELSKALDKRKTITSNLSELRNEIIKSSVQLGHIEANLEEMDRRCSEKQILLTQKNRLTSDIEVYSEVSKAFSKDGIQSIIMENVAEDLKNYTNSILNQICSEPLSVDFVTQRQTGSGGWREDFNIIIMIGNNEMDFEDISGGEQVRVAIALRLALSRLLMQRVGSNIKFLLLDEVDQTLDGQGVDALSDAILSLSSEFKIMVITHNEAMKERFEHVITVLKEPSGSSIRQ